MGIWIIGVVGAITFTAVGGGGGFLLFIPCYMLFWKYTSYRGLLFIRAFLFLKTLGETGDSATANMKANALTSQYAYFYGAEAVHFANKVHNGRNLAVIDMAESLGFQKKNIFGL